MFDNIKDIYNLRKQAQEMEKRLSAERVEGSSSNALVRLVLSGKQDLLEVQIAERPAYDRKELAQAFRDAYGQAQNKLQKLLTEKFRDLI
jgi:DNA-binding protein YbaB